LPRNFPRIDLAQVMPANLTSDEVEETASDKEVAAQTETTQVGVGKEEERDAGREDTFPGWTIMLPVMKNGNKRGGVSTTSTNVDSDESKASGDIRVAETKDNGDARGEAVPLEEVRSNDELLGEEEDEERHHATREDGIPRDRSLQINDRAGTVDGVGNERGEYKVYKRRWFGLLQLVLLNIIVSWDVSFPPLPTLHGGRRTLIPSSGFLSLQARPPSPITMPSPNRPSTGSVPASSLPLSWSRPW
jgi:hypothetical protein